MSPRRNQRRDAPAAPDFSGVRRGVDAVQEWGDGEWLVRAVPGDAAGKAYRCPGCEQEIRPGVAHLVTWPADERGGAADRRHWHQGCWQARDRRAPGVLRGRDAPRYGRST